MKKTQKRIFGFFGLVFVVAMTFLAATLPPNEASAATPNSFEDRLTVLVTNPEGTPSVNIVSPSDDDQITGDTAELVIDYNSTERAALDVTFIGQNPDGTDADPIVITDFHVFDLGFETGQTTLPIDLNGYGGTDFGYGTFIFSFRNTGADGVEVPGQRISFVHTPVSADPKDEEKDDGSVDVDIDFPTEDDGEGNIVPSEIGKIVITVTNPDGKPVYGPITYDPQDLINEDGSIKPINLPFGEFADITGNYTIAITAYDKSDNYLYTLYRTRYYEVAPPVPDTGMFFQNLNISKEDYIITGLIIFFVFAIVGFGIVARDRQNRKR